MSLAILRQSTRYALTAHAWVGPLLVVMIMVYFAYHAFPSERGLSALGRLQAEHERVSGELAQVKAERESLERRVQHLSPESLDLDLVDEQARRVLGTSDPDEMMVMLPKKSDTGR